MSSVMILLRAPGLVVNESRISARCTLGVNSRRCTGVIIMCVFCAEILMKRSLSK